MSDDFLKHVWIASVVYVGLGVLALVKPEALNYIAPIMLILMIAVAACFAIGYPFYWVSNND